MDQFIVLGLIPGTHIQITFLPWLLVVGGLAGFWLARRAARNRRLRITLVALAINRACREVELTLAQH